MNNRGKKENLMMNDTWNDIFHLNYYIFQISFSKWGIGAIHCFPIISFETFNIDTISVEDKLFNLTIFIINVLLIWMFHLSYFYWYPLVYFRAKINFLIRWWKFYVDGWAWLRFWWIPYLALLFWIHRTPFLAFEIISKFITIHYYSMCAVTSWSMGVLYFQVKLQNVRLFLNYERIIT